MGSRVRRGDRTLPGDSYPVGHRRYPWILSGPVTYWSVVEFRPCRHGNRCLESTFLDPVSPTRPCHVRWTAPLCPCRTVLRNQWRCRTRSTTHGTSDRARESTRDPPTVYGRLLHQVTARTTVTLDGSDLTRHTRPTVVTTSTPGTGPKGPRNSSSSSNNLSRSFETTVRPPRHTPSR